MAKESGKGSGGGKFMDNGRGMCAFKDNPMSAASRTAPKCGPGMNSDQQRANRLLQEVLVERESLRGKSGM